MADLYDEVTMPPELRRAHQENDCAVMDAYGFSTKMTESECVAELFKMYQSLTMFKMYRSLTKFKMYQSLTKFKMYRSLTK